MVPDQESRFCHMINCFCTTFERILSFWIASVAENLQKQNCVKSFVFFYCKELHPPNAATAVIKIQLVVKILLETILKKYCYCIWGWSCTIVRRKRFAGGENQLTTTRRQLLLVLVSDSARLSQLSFLISHGRSSLPSRYNLPKLFPSLKPHLAVVEHWMS